MFNKEKIFLKKSVNSGDFYKGNRIIIYDDFYEGDCIIFYDNEIVLKAIRIRPRKPFPETYSKGSLYDLWDKGYRFELRQLNYISSNKNFPLNNVLDKLSNYSYRYDKNNKYYNYTYCRTPYEAKYKAGVLIKYAIENGMFKEKVKDTSKELNVNFVNANNQYYPTPQEIVGKMYAKINWKNVKTVLEPSAGNGNLIKNINNMNYFRSKIDGQRYERNNNGYDIDCCEIDTNLRYILEGKHYRVVHDDFLTYDTRKHYDLIIMNPPFANGASHLMKAIYLAENNGGSQICCLLNKETILNPYSNVRKDVIEKIIKYKGKVFDLKNCFKKARRKTNVDVCMVYIDIPKPEVHSDIWENLEKARKQFETESKSESNTLAVDNDIENLILQYNMQLATIEKCRDEITVINQHCLVPLNLSCQNENVLDNLNEVIIQVRLKYWETLFNKPSFTAGLTESLLNEYRNNILNMQEYEFSMYNIQMLVAKMQARLKESLEDNILKLFDELTFEHSYYPECKNNRHYYDGWKTNKAHKIDKKVIIPFNCFNSYQTNRLEPYKMAGKLKDIEKILNYLNPECGLTSDSNLVDICRQAEIDCQYRNIKFKYFKANFYKKGTIHLTFNCPDIIKALNIYAGQKKGWLPPSYGKSSYDNMTTEEKEVVDSFQGKADYNNMMKNKARYLFNSEQALLTAAV